MNEKIAKKWVKALRSRKYRQGKQKLNPRKNTYCCLGVLQMCVLKLPETATGEVLSYPAMETAGMFDEAGIPCVGGVTIGKHTYDSLAEANDGGRRFSSIATWIENNWQRL